MLSSSRVSAIQSRFINAQPLSLKTACVEVLGTQRKTDVLRVLRTCNILDYSAGGSRHEILGPGFRYFTYDLDRREAKQQLIPTLNLGPDWANRAGTEIYITPMNALCLKRDVLDPRVMQLLDPPSRATRNGLAADELVSEVGGDLGALEELLSETSAEDLLDADEDTTTGWRAQALSAMANGAEVPAHVRAGAYLENDRVRALLNETAVKVGIDLSNTQAGIEHVTNWCSFTMRQELENVFESDADWNRYLAGVQEMTAEAWLGYSPEFAIGRSAVRA
jgi:hypothetical protein